MMYYLQVATSAKKSFPLCLLGAAVWRPEQLSSGIVRPHAHRAQKRTVKPVPMPGKKGCKNALLEAFCIGVNARLAAFLCPLLFSTLKSNYYSLKTLGEA